MAKIVRAQKMGYCMGVERAVKMAEDNLKIYKDLISLGLLIHNETENKRLANLGLRFKELDELEAKGNGQALLVRAHGMDPKVRQDLEERGYQLVDATCPLVVMNQKDVTKARKDNYHVVIVGKPLHAEIVAMKGFADANRLSIISSEEQAMALDVPEKELFILSQTTLRPDLYEDIKQILASRYELKEYRRSICPATQERQKAVKELAQEVEVIVVVGDANSANTKGLQDSALAAGVPAYLVSAAKDVQLDKLKDFSRIGLTAGASVPDYIIDEVEAYINKYLE